MYPYTTKYEFICYKFHKIDAILSQEEQFKRIISRRSNMDVVLKELH